MRQVLRQFIFDLFQSYQLQYLQGLFLDIGFVAAVGGGIKIDIEETGPGMEMEGGGDILQNGKIGKKGIELESPPDAQGGDLMRFFRVISLPSKTTLPLVGG